MGCVETFFEKLYIPVARFGLVYFVLYCLLLMLPGDVQEGGPSSDLRVDDLCDPARGRHPRREQLILFSGRRVRRQPVGQELPSPCS